MKLGIIGTRGIPNRYGGFEQFAAVVAPRLVQMGYAVTVYCSSTHPYREKEWQGVSLVHCPDPEPWMGTAGQFVYDWHCINHAGRRNFDVILQLGYTSNSIWRHMLPKNSVIVTNMDGLEWKRSKYNKWVQRFLKKAEGWAVHSSDVLIADSPVIAHYLQQQYNRPAVHIAYGADVFEQTNVAIIQALELQPFQYHLVIARLEPENNIELILEAHAAAQQQPLLVVVGAITNRFAKRVQSQYQQNVLFMGAVWDQEVLNNLRAFSRLYLHGHSVGGTNPSLLEAMGCGALIAAHDNAFNRAVLEDNAFYFSNAKDLTVIFEKDWGQNHPWRHAVKERIKDQFTWSRITNQLHQCLQHATHVSR